MRLHPHSKPQRNKTLVRFKEENPTASLREMAEVFGISAERVRKILLRDTAKYKQA